MDKAVTAKPAATQSGAVQEFLVFQTFSICPQCVVVEKKSQSTLVPAWILHRGDQIYFKSLCKDHGSNETLYCSNAQFFYRMESYRIKGSSIMPSPSKLPDIEEMNFRLTYNAKSTKKNYPLVNELVIFRNGALISKDDIKAEVNKIVSLYPPNHSFVLRVSGKLAIEIGELNDRCLYINSLLPNHPILVELSFERLHLIGREENSVFFKPNVYPALKYFVPAGSEKQCLSDLLVVFNSLQEFSDIQIYVTIIVELPLPNLTDILALIRSKPKLVRFIVISMERSPSELLSTLKKQIQQSKTVVSTTAPSNTSSTAPSNTAPSTNATSSLTPCDPYQLLAAIQQQTKGTITVDDFLPASVGMLMEPLLANIGIGNFTFRPSPYCGFGTVLINWDKTESVPITRLFNLTKFYAEFYPQLLKGFSFGFFTASKLKKLFKSCELPGHPLPDLLSYFSSKDKFDVTKTFLKQIQFLVVHNNMDLFCFDMERRCDCVSTTTSDACPSFLASSCTGCI